MRRFARPAPLALALASAALFLPAARAHAAAATPPADHAAVGAEIRAMQAQITELQAKLDALQRREQAHATPAATKPSAKVARTQAKPKAAEPALETPQSAHAIKPRFDLTATSHTKDTGITLGGAVRFQYLRDSYDPGNGRRHGDAEFDIFRLDLHGKVHGILLDAQWRWFTYMSTIQHAWVGYDFTPDQQLQVGLTRIPFGNQPFDSHSYFFSSNYYLGLEDTYAFGSEYVYSGKRWNAQLAFFKNDATGSVGSSGDRINSYSYDVVGIRTPGEDTFAKPTDPAGAANSVAARVARTFHPSSDLSIQVGASGLRGGLYNLDRRIGHYGAYALHTNVDYRRWNFQLQAVHYAYHTRTHARRLAVGAYAFYDSIPARANTYTANVAYHLPVNWGPIEALDFYNDYSLVTHKSDRLPNTFMDDLGVGVSAGDLYTYFDYVTARNQPFIGGSLAGDGGVDHRLNVNFGFYF